MLKKVSLDIVNSMNKNTLMEALGIECIEIGNDYVVSRMPVDHRTHQPMGLLQVWHLSKVLAQWVQRF
jgi:1,4-dihydroxy-2-naphthoyl-CoA hydrolase